MGEKTKTQRPRKRKVGGPPSEAPEGPPRSRARRKERRPPPEALEAGGPPQGPPKGPPKRPHKGAPKGPPQQDEEAQQQLRALETLLFGAPTATAGGLEGGGSNGEGQEAASSSSSSSSSSSKKRKRKAASSSSSSSSVAPAAAAAAAEEGAVWVDPADAQLVVDIAANPKLRKLQQQQQEKQISGEEFHRRLQALHRTLSSSSSSSSKQSLLWIQEARERKRRALEESELLGELPSGLESTGQEGPLSKGEGLVAAAAAAARKQRGGPLGAPLAAGKINVRRLEDANKQGPSLCAVSCLDFHPKSNILLTAGRDKTLRLFLVDGAKNPRLESVHLKDFPVSKAFFSLFNFGETLLMTSSASRALAEYDLHRGKVYQVPGIAGRREERAYHFLSVSPGIVSDPSTPVVNTFAVASAASQSVLICDASSKRLLSVLQMNAPVVGMAYHPHRPTCVLTADADANVYEWELRTGRCLAKTRDPSCGALSAFAVSPPPAAAAASSRPFSVMALGSRSGFTDLFTLPEEGPVVPPAFKSLGHLTTAVTTAALHKSNEVLCLASKWKKDSLKLVHLPSATVFQDWPTPKTPLHYVTSAAFSERRGLFAVGNAAGRVLLYHLRDLN